MDALREGVYLRAYGQKDPLIEYKTEAYDMFVELMANIKNEVLHNLFRSTSNLQAFENFLATLPQFLLREQGADRADGNGPTRACVSQSAQSAARRWQWRAEGDGDGEVSNSICRCAARCRKSAATNRAPAAAGRNTRTAAAAPPNDSPILLRGAQAARLSVAVLYLFSVACRSRPGGAQRK